MKATQKLHDMGQSLWLDNITRGLLTKGTLRRYIQEFSVTGLTSNPTIFDHALRNSREYDDGIQQKLQEGKSGEALFFELAIEDLRQAADLFRPIQAGRTAWTAGCLLRYRPCWPTTPLQHSPRPVRPRTGSRPLLPDTRQNESRSRTPARLIVTWRKTTEAFHPAA